MEYEPREPEPEERKPERPAPEINQELQPIEEKEEKTNKININEVGVNELSKITGVSSTFARNIVRWRNTRGNFRNWNTLLRVLVMNRRILENIKKIALIRCRSLVALHYL